MPGPSHLGPDGPDLHPTAPRRTRLNKRAIVQAQLVLQNKQLEQQAARDSLEILLALQRTQIELASQFRRHLGAPDPKERIDADYLRAMIIALAITMGARGGLEDISRAMERTVARAASNARELSRAHFRAELVRFGGLFDGTTAAPASATGGGSISGGGGAAGGAGGGGGRGSTPPGGPDRRFGDLVIDRHPSSVRRYPGQVRTDIQNTLERGHRQGKTFEQMTRDLQRNGGPRGVVVLEERKSGPVTETIPEGLFKRHRNYAERVVRTESVEAYNREHEKAIAGAAGDDPELMKRWDASVDKRICPDCRALDGQVVPVDQPFSNGLMRPPAHPNCRCALTPWKKHWPALEGMGPNVDADTDNARQRLA